MWIESALTRRFQRRGLIKQSSLGGNDPQQVVPRLNKGLGSLSLELLRQYIDIDTGLGKQVQNVLAVSAVGRQQLAQVGVGCQRSQCGLGHGVHRERRSQGLYVENVGSLGVFGPRARPQEALRTAAEVVNTLPAADEYRCHRVDSGI